MIQPNWSSWAEARACLAPGANLIDAHVLEFAEAPHEIAGPRSVRPIRIDGRIADYLAGGDRIDPNLNEYLHPCRTDLGWDDLPLEKDYLERLTETASFLKSKAQAGVSCQSSMLFHGAYGSGRSAAAKVLCGELQIPLLMFDAAKARLDPEHLPERVRRACREALLQEAGLYFSGCDSMFPEGRPDASWSVLIEEVAAWEIRAFLACDRAWEPKDEFAGRRFSCFEFPVPGYLLRRDIWDRALAESNPALDELERGTMAESMANSFRMTQGQIHDAVRGAWSRAARRHPGEPAPVRSDYYEAARVQSSQRLSLYGRRVEPRRGLSFETLVLPEQNLRQLAELRQRIKYRGQVYSGLGLERRLSLGKGLIVLFSGASGTGKTMTALLLAREQGVDLYRVDLSTVVSKYVGETEKNLGKVFEEAEDANAIIFFDEADALFGKRGEVKEARDRWANTEINYLLQRVEEYSGVVILASNLRQNIDDAFMRRIHAIVEFPFPGAESRFKIWIGMFPEGVPRPEDHQIRDLANRFRLPGGSIKNIMIDAAARAVAAREEAGRSWTETEITMRHLVNAIAREFQKTGRPITEREFAAYFPWVREDILLQ